MSCLSATSTNASHMAGTWGLGGSVPGANGSGKPVSRLRRRGLSIDGDGDAMLCGVGDVSVRD